MRLRLSGACFFAACLAVSGREPQAPADPTIDPLAIAVLERASATIRDARNYSFTARVARERLGTNGQIITQFATHKVTVSRPDKLRIETHAGQDREVQLLFDRGSTYLYSPGPKLYAATMAPPTLDASLAQLEKRGIDLPLSNLLESNPYESLRADLRSAYVVGRTDAFGVELHQLAFTEPQVEWQLWVEGGERPLPRRVEIIDRSSPGSPRITVDLLDWNFNPDVSPARFVFTPPEGARQISFPRAVAAVRKGKKS